MRNVNIEKQFVPGFVDEAGKLRMGEPDNLFGSKKRKKQKAADVRAMAAELAKTQNLSQTNIQTALLAADGKLTKKDKKLIKQTGRLEAKTNRVAERGVTKTERARAKFAAKNEDEPVQVNPNDAVTTTPQDQVFEEDLSRYTPLPDAGIGGGIGDMGATYANDEPTGWMADEKELQNVNVSAKKTPVWVFIVAGLGLLIVLYFLTRKKQ